MWLFSVSGFTPTVCQERVSAERSYVIIFPESSLYGLRLLHARSRPSQWGMQLPSRLHAEIARALRAGKQPLEIARELGVSLLTVADLIFETLVREIEREPRCTPSHDFPKSVDR